MLYAKLRALRCSATSSCSAVSTENRRVWQAPEDYECPQFDVWHFTNSEICPHYGRYDTELQQYRDCLVKCVTGILAGPGSGFGENTGTHTD